MKENKGTNERKAEKQYFIVSVPVTSERLL